MDIEFKPIKGGFLGHHRKEMSKSHAHLHYHDSYELYYLLEGERNYLTENKLYSLNSNWVTLSRPYIIHGTNGKEYERLLVSFSEDFLSTYFQPIFIDVFRKVFSIDAIPAQIIEKHPQIKQLFFKIIEAYNHDNLKVVALHLGLLLFELYDLTNLSLVEETSDPASQMQDILAYISNNMSTIKTLKQVSNHFYISQYYLSHQFKKRTGFTFIEFLTKIRISRALHLLEHTDESIASISEACGFETPTYFGVVFKKKMHMTPLQYRVWIKEQALSSKKHQDN